MGDGLINSSSKLKNGQIGIKPAEQRDCETIWKWRNDETTRKFSFNTRFIPIEEHKIWFRKALRAKDKKILVLEQNKNLIGVIRFDINSTDRVAEININIAPEARQRGFGSTGIKKACEFAFNRLGIERIIAKIKEENVISIKAFSRANFTLIRKNEIVIMEKTQNGGIK